MLVLVLMLVLMLVLVRAVLSSLFYNCLGGCSPLGRLAWELVVSVSQFSGHCPVSLGFLVTVARRLLGPGTRRFSSALHISSC